MEKFKYLIYKFTGSVYVPPYLKNTEDKLLVHISDTPVNFFDALSSLLKKLNPFIIVHTGDLVDNLKLEYSSSLVPRYEKEVKKLIDILETSSAEEIYITPGNHDNIDIIKKYTNRTKLLKNNSIIKTQCCNFKISHYCKDLLNAPEEFNLYGHDIYLETNINDRRKTFLNVITSINVVSLCDKKTYKLLYPFGTDDMRLKRGKIGL